MRPIHLQDGTQFLFGLFLGLFTILTTCTTGTQRTDSHEVTVAEFRDFVEQTGHRTTAEEYGWSYVAITNSRFEAVGGANWRKPDGKNQAQDDMPVTQVSWYDAVEYCKWRGTRLETITEWSNQVRWSDEGNTMDTGNGNMLPAKETKARLGNVWEWTTEGAVVGGSYLCSKTSCAGNTPSRFIHWPGKDAGNSHIGFRVKP